MATTVAMGTIAVAQVRIKHDSANPVVLAVRIAAKQAVAAKPVAVKRAVAAQPVAPKRAAIATVAIAAMVFMHIGQR